MRERANELEKRLKKNPNYIETKLRKRSPEEEERLNTIARHAYPAAAEVAENRVSFLSPPGNMYAISWSGYFDFEHPSLGNPPYHLSLDLKKTPQLLKPELWWDLGHLNEDGARIYSRYVARELCALEKREEAR